MSYNYATRQSRRRYIRKLLKLAARLPLANSSRKSAVYIKRLLQFAHFWISSTPMRMLRISKLWPVNTLKRYFTPFIMGLSLARNAQLSTISASNWKIWINMSSILPLLNHLTANRANFLCSSKIWKIRWLSNYDTPKSSVNN